MNRYRLSKAGINAKEGIERFSGNAEIYETCLSHFPDDANFKLLCEAINAKDAHAAFTAAHALKGIAGNLSITTLYADLLPLVELLRSGSLDGVERLLEPVAQDYDAVLAALKN